MAKQAVEIAESIRHSGGSDAIIVADWDTGAVAGVHERGDASVIEAGVVVLVRGRRVESIFVCFLRWRVAVKGRG